MWETTTIRIERSEVVRGDLGQLWALLSSPAVWSLWPDPTFMFAVPEADALRFFIGPTTRGTSKVLFEVCDQVPGAMVRLRTLPTGRQEFTLSVAASRRGTARATVRVKEIVPRRQETGFERKRRTDIKRWLSAVRAVIEGRARWPGADMPAALLQACMARPQIEVADTASAAAMINADLATVWDAVHPPETALDLGQPPTIYCGYVPGTPQGQAGEMQYFVHPQGDGKLIGYVVVVTETAPQRTAFTHGLGTHITLDYLLTPESASGQTQLKLTCRWPAPKLADAAESARSQMAADLHRQVTGYKSLIEAASGRA